MRLLKLTTALLLFSVASPVYAVEDRLKPLMNSHLIVRLEEEGTWQVSTQGSSVRYDCLACTDDVSAELEVVAPYTAGKYASPAERYLTERKAFCADIVVHNQGRCLATEKTGWRADLLTGFHSIHEIDGKSVTEIVFFYNNRNWGASRGPEIIRGTIYTERNAAVPDGFSELLLHHMAKLTAFY